MSSLEGGPTTQLGAPARSALQTFFHGDITVHDACIINGQLWETSFAVLEAFLDKTYAEMMHKLTLLQIRIMSEEPERNEELSPRILQEAGWSEDYIGGLFENFDNLLAHI